MLHRNSRPFWPVKELASRWGVFVPEIIETALARELQLAALIGPTRGNGGEVFRGVVGVDPAELWRLAPRTGSTLSTAGVSRIWADGLWRELPAPVEIGLDAVIVEDRERARFEDAHDLFQSGSNRPGPDFKYRWIEMLQWLAVHLHEEGLPATQKELLDRCQDWLIENSPDGELPTERSIRTYVAPIWKALRKEGATP